MGACIQRTAALSLVLLTSGAGAYASDYVFVRDWGSYGTGDGQFRQPESVALDAAGDVYVVESHGDRLQKFTSEGTFLAKWGSTGGGDGQFDWPAGVAVDAIGDVYVADHENHRVQKFTSGGVFATKWGSQGTGNGEFNGPARLDIGGSGDVYVADHWNHRVQRFTKDGAYVMQWGSEGAGDGQFSFPAGLAVGPDGSIYVTEWSGHRVQRFTAEGVFVSKWGAEGNGDGQFQGPLGVAVDAAGNVYVADSANHRIQKFTADGTFLTKWGSYGSADGQFDLPVDLAVDASGLVYVVTRQTKHRVHVFAPPPSNTAPTDPTSVTISPSSPKTADDLTVSASGSTDDDGDPITYEYEWAESTDGGTSWGSWGNAGATLSSSSTAKTEQWKARARAYDGTDYSNWVESSPVTIANTAPTQPSVDVTPNKPPTDSDLTVAASGSTDADGDTVTYSYEWSKGDVHQGAYDDLTTVPSSATSKGEVWKCVATPNDGTDDGPTDDDSVTIIGDPPTDPTSVAISPTTPVTGDDLTATASGSTHGDGDPITYQYSWSKSTDGGTSWGSWGNPGATLGAFRSAKDEQWKARSRAKAAGAYSNWAGSSPVTIGNTIPSAPDTPTITPSTPATGDSLSLSDGTGSDDPDVDDGVDTLTYEYEWSKDSFATSVSGQTLDASQTTKGESWVGRVRANDGTDTSDWTESSPGVIGNTAPTLAWLGTTGYETDGVDPEVGEYPVDRFTFRVIYTDVDGGLPSYCRLVLDREGTTRTFDMRRGSGNTATGRQFLFRRCLAPGFYRYRVEAHDGEDAAAGPPTGWVDGPSVSPRQNARPDGLVLDGSRWLGNNWYNTTGAKQRVNGTVAAGAAVTYSVKLQNDRGEPDTLLVWGPSGAGVWGITYKDVAGADITTAMTGAGWQPPELAAGGETTMSVEVGAAGHAQAGAWKAVVVRVGRALWGPSKNAESADAVKMVTTVEGDGASTIASSGPQLTSLTVTQTQMGAEVRFTLSASAHVNARVLNIAGRPVRTLCTARDCDAGTNTLLWNATSDQGLQVPIGVYLVEVAAKHQEGECSRALARVRAGR